MEEIKNLYLIPPEAKVGGRQLLLGARKRRRSRAGAQTEYLEVERGAAGAAASSALCIETLMRRKSGRTKWFLMICMMQV